MYWCHFPRKNQTKVWWACSETMPLYYIAHYYWKSTSLRFLTHFILNKASQHVNCRWSLVALLIWNRIQTLLYELPGGLALAGVIQVKDIKHFKANVYGLDHRLNLIGSTLKHNIHLAQVVPRSKESFIPLIHPFSEKNQWKFTAGSLIMLQTSTLLSLSLGIITGKLTLDKYYPVLHN